MTALRRDVERLTALRIAFAFHRPDVDRFLDEVDHEQYEEWRAYLAIEPHGWDAMRIATTRLSYMTVQAHSTRRLREQHFELKTATPSSAATELARWEAFAIRTEIAEAMQKDNDNG